MSKHFLFDMKTFVQLLIVIFLYVCGLEGKISFVKDQSLNVVFPPTNIRTVQGIPEGHLRPLGYQKKPDGKIREEKDILSPHTFYMRYIKPSRAVAMRQLLKSEPVIETWEEDDYLRDKFGKLNLTITVKKEQVAARTKRRMIFKKFLMDYMYENWYLSNTVPKPMAQELPVPPILRCGTYKDRLVEAELWMSSGGTSSTLHSHEYHNLHCVLHGRKDFILIDTKHKDVFDYKETYPNSGAGFSPLDMDMINLFRQPKIAQIPWVWSTLMSGDCIYVPAGNLHQVRSYGRGISYTVQFSPSLAFDSSDCNQDDPDEEPKKKRRKKKGKDKKKEISEGPKKDLKLSDVSFVWTYDDGVRRLSDQQLKPATLKKLLLLLLKDGDQLHFDQFSHFYNEALHKDANKPEAREAFSYLTNDQLKKELSRDQVTSLSKSQLKKVCNIFNTAPILRHDEL